MRAHFCLHDSHMLLLNSTIKRSLLLGLAGYGIVGLALFVYWPGLDGPFLFDDLTNLDRLGELGGVENWAKLRAYLAGAFAGPTGRPLALLSFLINDYTWPSEAESFKYTNLMIHVLCGLALWLCTVGIYRAHRGQDSDIGTRAHLVALLVFAAWLLHPYLVSTTLYVVQRMAQLSTLFCLLGLWGYLLGRLEMARNSRRGYLGMAVALVTGTVLATFSKENGALLPTLALTLEGTLLRPTHTRLPALDRRWMTVFLVVPTLFIVVLLLWKGFSDGFFTEYSHREFSPYERLLTQTRVLFVYLGNWFLPQLYTTGMFHDDYTLSTGLLTPPTTILAIFGHVLLLSIAFIAKRRYPTIAFALLFFYAGHLLESTLIGLELFFEHRNYLPAAFLFLPVFHYALHAKDMRIVRVLPLAFLGILGTFTYLSSTLWSSYREMALVWAIKNPDSPRAQFEAARVLFTSGERLQALDLIGKAANRMPEELDINLLHVLVKCKTVGARPSDIQQLRELARQARYDVRELNAFEFFHAWSLASDCRGLNINDYLEIVQTLADNPENSAPNSAAYSHLHYLLGLGYISKNRPELAKQAWQQALSARPSPDTAMAIAALLASQGHHELALEFSSKAIEYIKTGKLGASGRTETEYLSLVHDFQNTLKQQKAAHDPVGEKNDG